MNKLMYSNRQLINRMSSKSKPLYQYIKIDNVYQKLLQEWKPIFD